MRLINSNQDELQVAVELNAQEVADLVSLLGKITELPERGAIEDTARETVRPLYMLLIPLVDRYDLPRARTCRNLYIINNLRINAPAQEQRVDGVLVGEAQAGGNVAVGQAAFIPNRGQL